MKLVLIADTFPPLRSSGAVQLRDLSREIIRQGHTLTVLLPSTNLVERWSLNTVEGVEVLRLSAPRIKDIGYVRRTIGEWYMPYAMMRNLQHSPLANACWDGVLWYSPSIFHAPLVRSLKIANKCKGYLIIRDIFPEWAVDLGLMRKGLAYRFFQLIAKAQYDAADIIGVQTPGNLSYFDGWLCDRQGRQLEVLQNWLGAPASDSCQIRVADTPLAGRKIFVYAGNMGIAQNISIFIDLAHRLQDQRDLGFLFVGRGSEVVRLRQRSESLGLDNVVFHDEISPDEIPDLYSQCHAGIVALDHRHKSHNIPGKFLTYLQSGLPVLANVNNENDLANLVRQESIGQVCETNALDDLEKCCKALVSQINTDHKVQARSSELFQSKFSVDKAVCQIVRALRQ